MLNAKDFRKIARIALNGNWAVAVGTGFVATLLGGGSILTSESGIFSKVNNEYFKDWLQSPDTIAPWVIGILVAGLIWALIVTVIGGAVSLGYAQFNLNMVDNKSAEFHDLFSQFHRFGAGFCMRFLMGLYTFLWSLLLVIPGIIAIYRYAMTPYIMLEHPELGANEAITYSKQMMIGNKWDLFCLLFSFIGWNILSILTLGIGYLWVSPYQEAAIAAFYRKVSGTADYTKILDEQN